MKYGVQGSIAAMLFSASLHAATIPQSGQVPWSLDDSNRMDEVSYLMAAAAKGRILFIWWILAIQNMRG